MADSILRDKSKTFATDIVFSLQAVKRKQSRRRFDQSVA